MTGWEILCFVLYVLGLMSMWVLAFVYIHESADRRGEQYSTWIDVLVTIIWPIVAFMMIGIGVKEWIKAEWEERKERKDWAEGRRQ